MVCRDWIGLSQAKDTLLVVLNTAVNFGFHKMRGIYWPRYSSFLEKDRPTALAYVRGEFLVYNIASNGKI